MQSLITLFEGAALYMGIAGTLRILVALAAASQEIVTAQIVVSALAENVGALSQATSLVLKISLEDDARLDCRPIIT
ncbi:hypothetical protein N7523_001398 [Penicillium sp. IBT 18751x]|nr:hypothetical protein N7523_001398 [Penicillium sp. IBT 18751x]